MNTRLTKALREEIAEAVYIASDLPGRLADMGALAKTEAVKSIKASWPPGFEEALKGVDPTWFASSTQLYVPWTIDHPTKGVYRLSADDVGDLSSSYIYFDAPVPVPATGASDGSTYFGVWMYDVYRPLYRAWAADEQKLSQSTWALLNSYRTVEALLKAAPEMKQFIPTTSVSYPPPAVPVSNVITTFLERGITFQPA